MKYHEINYFINYIFILFLFACNDNNTNHSIPKNYSFRDNISFDEYIIYGYNVIKKNITNSYIEIYSKKNNKLLFKTNLKDYSIEKKNVLTIGKKYFYYDSGTYFLGASSGDIYGTLIDVDKLKEFKIHIKIGFNNLVFVDTTIENNIINIIVGKYDIENYKRVDIKYDENY